MDSSTKEVHDSMARGPLDFFFLIDIIHKFYEILKFRFKKILLCPLNIFPSPFKNNNNNNLAPNNNIKNLRKQQLQYLATRPPKKSYQKNHFYEMC